MIKFTGLSFKITHLCQKIYTATILLLIDLFKNSIGLNAIVKNDTLYSLSRKHFLIKDFIVY